MHEDHCEDPCRGGAATPCMTHPTFRPVITLEAQILLKPLRTEDRYLLECPSDRQDKKVLECQVLNRQTDRVDVGHPHPRG